MSLYDTGFIFPNTWCIQCKNLELSNGCEGCKPNIIGDEYYMPTGFVKKEETKMSNVATMEVTIIGSLSKKDRMNECEEFFKKLGAKVNNPADASRREKSLVAKQESWIEAIENADLVVVIPKEYMLAQDSTATKYGMTLGESTSYELAIARRFGKQVVFW